MALQQANVPDRAHSELEFHKYYGDSPLMHPSASPEQIARFCKDNPRDFYCFGVPREYPLADFELPAAALLTGEAGTLEKLTLTGQPGEYFAFQIVVWSPDQALGALHIESSGFPLPVRVFLQETGARINLAAGKLQSFWCMIDLPATPGQWQGEFAVAAEGFAPVKVVCRLNSEGEMLPDGGVSDDRRLARLRWLDSEIGTEKVVPPPFCALRREGNKLFFLGRSLTLSPCGLPEAAESFFEGINDRIGKTGKPILSSPFRFLLDGKDVFASSQCRFTEETPEKICWEGRAPANGAELVIRGSLEYDGFASFRCALRAPGGRCREEFSLDFGAYGKEFMGLNRHGGTVPEKLRWYWDPERNQDSFWVGSLNGGLRLRLRDHSSRTPLTNCYYHFAPIVPPPAWSNGGQGGIALEKCGEGKSRITLFPGPRTLQETSVLDFDFELQFTPFQCTAPERHWKQRFFHPYMHDLEKPLSETFTPEFFAALRRDGVQVVNLHHALQENPFINLPFTDASLPYLQKFVETAHREGLKVCLYYTLRELSVHIPEFWAMASLRGEIFFPGPGRESRPVTAPQGPHPYLLKNCKFPFLSAWAESVKEGPHAGVLDLALETTPDARRLENYFLEGLRYLLERCPLDGLYLDDTSLTREGFQRLWRIFRNVRGCDPILSLHSWNSYNDVRQFFGNSSPVLRDMAFYPFVTSLWLGESFDYEGASPEYYLTEISGLPCGLMSEMLSGGGNPWRGMLFGMTGRYGWLADPRPLWELFDDMDLPSCRMIGFYDKVPAVRCSSPLVRATLYIHPDGKRALLAAASWSRQEERVTFTVDPQQLPEGLRDFRTFRAPRVRTLQEEEFRVPSGEALPIQPGKGVLMLLEE